MSRSGDNHKTAPATVAPWLVGCWRRRSITFADGVEDTSSFVIWLQTESWYADLRIPAERINLPRHDSLNDYSIDELLALTDQQGSAGICELNNERAQWRAQLRYHIYDAWPEPGDLRRTGPCLIEFAPSGDYVEDWRLQPGSSGPIANLTLIDERGPHDEAPARRNGRWLQCGDHAALILDRRKPPPASQSLVELAKPYRNGDNPDIAALATLLDMECSYATRPNNDPTQAFVIQRSTLPFREGISLEPPQLQASGEWLQHDGQQIRRWQP